MLGTEVDLLCFGVVRLGMFSGKYRQILDADITQPVKKLKLKTD